MYKNAYIKNKKNFYTIHHATPTSFDAIIGSDEKDTGSFTFVDDDKHTFVSLEDPYWLCYEDYIFKITSIESQDDIVTVTVEPPLSAFSRPCLDFSFRFYNIGNWVQSIIWDNFQDPTAKDGDWQWSMKYITVYDNDGTLNITPEHTTEFMVPKIESQPGTNMMPSGLFDPYEYFQLLNRRNTMFDISFTNENLYIDVKTKPEKPYILINNDGKTKVMSFDYDKDIISKLRLYIIESDDSGNSLLKDPYNRSTAYRQYYLKPDGSHTLPEDNIIPEEQVSGRWEIGVVNAANENQIKEGITTAKLCDEEADKMFAKNQDKISIEFYSTVDLPWGYPVQIIIGDAVWSGIISRKAITTDDDRFSYKIGNMKTTATQKLLSLLD